MRFVVTTDPGLEDVAAAEVRERCRPIETLERPYGWPGQVRVEGATVAQLLGLSTVHHVIEVRHEGRARTLEDVRSVVAAADLPELAGADSFRVTSRRQGGHPFNSVDVERAAGGVLHRRHGLRVDLDHAAVNVGVHLYGDHLVVGLPRNEISLGNRIRRARALRSALKPTIAAAMLRLAGAHRGSGRLIDPLCGACTIPIEARRANPSLDVRASDWDPETVEVARGTLANHDMDVDVVPADARGLGCRAPESFDYIVTDPPYGVRQARRAGTSQLYRSLLSSFQDAIRPSGKIAMIVVKHRAFLASLERTELMVDHSRTIEAGGLQPRIFILSR